jgi:hypothetical protein
MTKYCMGCGKENEDQASFCVGCGQRFPDQAAPATQTAVQPPQAPASNLYTAEMGTGAHEHMLTDVYLRDSQGRVMLVARKPSILHSDYTIVDGSESVKGFIKAQTHLTHRTASVEDANHGVQGAVQVSNLSQNRVPPGCWIEDAAGNRLGTVMYGAGLAAFSGVKPDGSPIFEASLAVGQGMRETLTGLEHRAYAITLVDSGFPLPLLLAVIAALDRA